MCADRPENWNKNQTQPEDKDLMDQMHVLLNILEKNGALIGNKSLHFIWLTSSTATKHQLMATL